MTGPRSLSDAERLDWLQLIRSENVGPITFAQLLRRFGSARAALEALPELAKRGGRSRPIRIAARASAERELAGLTRIGARLIALGDPDYPLPLAAIADAPPLIAVRGRADLLLRPIVAMVGTRNASTNGRRFAAALARDLSAKGFTVASGLARGIDAAAHDGALAPGEDGASTIAVVAGGVDVVYPRENAALTERIAAAGAILAEQPLGLQPQARHFPHRNRLISGLARAVVVVEAALRSGSLITARLAAEQGRDVLAVPGSPLDPRARGSNSLIRDGAWLVETVEDVLAAIGPLGSGLQGPSGSQGRPLAGQRSAGPSLMPDRLPEPPGGPAPTSENSEGDRNKILEILGFSPSTVDDLVRRTHLSAASVAAALLELELAGRVERHSGGQISLIISTV